MSERYTESPTGSQANESSASQETPEAVGALVGRVKLRLESDFRNLFVEGEISNMSRPTSGHLYFTLKDRFGQMKCVMWKSNVAALRFRPTDGLAVRVRGSLSMYAARGDVQISVRSLAPAGEGALQRAFAELGRRLAAEGLFDKARKRPLPHYPECVGVVTSRSGAAVRDILTVLKRRYPLARVVVCPVVVQGDQASFEIVEALAAFNRLPSNDPQRPDVLILSRGGGSLEDLWAFNEERTVRAVHASGIPIVAGVGHETDTTLADLVADVRAATPSMAAELAVPDQQDLLGGLANLGRQHRAQVDERLRKARDLVVRAMHVREHGHPAVRLIAARKELALASRRLEAAANRRVQTERIQMDARMQTWRAVNPLRPLESGFALIESAGRRIGSADELEDGDSFVVTFHDGSVDARAERNASTTVPLTAPDSAQ